MPSNTSINYTTLDFDTLKDNLKGFLQSQSVFQDYDFEGSNMSVLLDVLAYNTQLNAFYLNMIGNEMFMDTALQRDSVVSHAKELNYVPRSFRSSVAEVDITLTDSSGAASLLIPRGTTFTGTAGNRNFTFVTDSNVQAIASPTTANTFVASGVSLYEGDYTSDNYVVNYLSESRYLITNKTVDTNSITVTIVEDNGATSLSYKKAESLFGLKNNSQVFFIQAAEGDTYEIVFGDGVIGRRPKDRSIVIIQYRKCNGELPNGIQKFTSDGDIGGATVQKIDVKGRASGGSIPESLSSIRFNAPRAFTTQERVVTAEDYETLLKANFSEINAVSAYGGEESYPPQFGKVIVAVDLKTTDSLPPSKRDIYTQFIKPRSPLAIDPVFVSPEYTYVAINTTVKYNINETSLNIEDIRTLVRSTVQQFNLTNINGFNKTLYYSRLISAIDGAQISIVSNDTNVTAMKLFEPAITGPANYVIDFGMALRDDIGQLYDTDVRAASELSILSSSAFLYAGRECFLEDDGEGKMLIVANEEDNHVRIEDIGTVDYNTGVVSLESFAPTFVFGNQVQLYGRTFERDIRSQRRTILSIRDADINIDVQQVRGR